MTRSPNQVHALRDDGVVLEPTRIANSETVSGAAEGSLGPTQTTMGTSFVSDTELLLRQRLSYRGAHLGSFNGLRYLFGLFDPYTGEGLASGSLLARTLFSFSIAG